MAKYEIFTDLAGEWRWRLRADNGEIVAQSESYPTKQHAARGAESAAAVSADAEQEEGLANGEEG